MKGVNKLSSKVSNPYQEFYFKSKFLKNAKQYYNNIPNYHKSEMFFPGGFDKFVYWLEVCDLTTGDKNLETFKSMIEKMHNSNLKPLKGTLSPISGDGIRNWFKQNILPKSKLFQEVERKTGKDCSMTLKNLGYTDQKNIMEILERHIDNHWGSLEYILFMTCYIKRTLTTKLDARFYERNLDNPVWGNYFIDDIGLQELSGRARYTPQQHRTNFLVSIISDLESVEISLDRTRSKFSQKNWGNWTGSGFGVNFNLFTLWDYFVLAYLDGWRFQLPKSNNVSAKMLRSSEMGGGVLDIDTEGMGALLIGEEFKSYQVRNIVEGNDAGKSFHTISWLKNILFSKKQGVGDKHYLDNMYEVSKYKKYSFYKPTDPSQLLVIPAEDTRVFKNIALPLSLFTLTKKPSILLNWIDSPLDKEINYWKGQELDRLRLEHNSNLHKLIKKTHTTSLVDDYLKYVNNSLLYSVNHTLKNSNMSVTKRDTTKSGLYLNWGMLYTIHKYVVENLPEITYFNEEGGGHPKGLKYSAITLDDILWSIMNIPITASSNHKDMITRLVQKWVEDNIPLNKQPTDKKGRIKRLGSITGNMRLKILLNFAGDLSYFETANSTTTNVVKLSNFVGNRYLWFPKKEGEVTPNIAVNFPSFIFIRYK